MASNRITYIATLIALFFFYLYCDSYMPLIILLVAVILPVFTFVLGIVSAKKTEVGVSAVMQSVLRGEEMRFGIFLKNNSVIPLSIVRATLIYTTSADEVTVKRKILTSLSGREEKTVYISAVSPHCAIVGCRIKSVRCSDALGLFSFRPKLQKREEAIVVMPKLIGGGLNISKQHSHVPDSDKYSETQKGDDSSQVFEVREYVPGDDVRRIHWGLSSKQDNLIVKDFSKPIADETVILLESGLLSDNKEESADRKDRLLTVFLTLANSIMNDEQYIEVRWYSEKNSNMFSYNITAQWEIYSVIKQFLCDELSSETDVSFAKNSIYDTARDSSNTYYIFDSSLSGIKDFSNENYTFIDIGQVDTFVE